MPNYSKPSRRIRSSTSGNLATNPEIKQKYLIQYQDNLWEVTRQKENSARQFVLLLASAILIGALFVSAGILQVKNGQPTFDYLHIPRTFLIPLISLIFVLMSFWGIIIVLDANYWENRNLRTISDIGRKILGNGEGSKFLSIGKSNLTYQYSTTSCIHIDFLFIVASLFAFGNLLLIQSMGGFTGVIQEIGVGVLGVLLSSLTIHVHLRDSEWTRRYHHAIDQTSGYRPSPVNYETYHLDKVWLVSPTFMWLQILSIFNFYSSVWATTDIFVNPINSPLNSLMVLYSVLSVAFLYLAKRNSINSYIKRVEEFIAQSMSERRLFRTLEVRSLRFISQTTSRVIFIFNSIAIVLSGLTLLHTYVKYFA